MKSNYLFPAVMKKVGWCMFVPSAIVLTLVITDVLSDELISFPTLLIGDVGFFSGNQSMVTFGTEGMLYEIATLFVALSLLFISFSKEEEEDEYVENIRMRSFVWAIKANTLLVILGTWFIFGILYLGVMIVFMYSMFLFFICKFNYELYKLRRTGNEE